MNKLRRSRLKEATLLLEKASCIVDFVRDDEQDSLDNIPENLREGELQLSMEDAINCLGEAVDSINDATEIIDRIINK